MSAAGPQINGGGDVTAFASGLVSLLQPVVIECDQRLQGVFDSQRLLAAQIDGLASQLDKFNAVSRTPALSPHIDKLLRAKARMVVINTTLANIQHRLVRIQREHAPAPRPFAEGVAPTSTASPSSTPFPSSPSSSSSQPAPTPAPSSSSSTSTSTAPAAAATQPAGGGGVMSSWLNKAKAALVEAPASLSNLAGPSSTTAQPAAATTAPSPSAGTTTGPPAAAARNPYADADLRSFFGVCSLSSRGGVRHTRLLQASSNSRPRLLNRAQRRRPSLRRVPSALHITIARARI